ncbi:hypothetical protein FRC09_015957, partial [Ceratobasidium sp. 395]
LFMRWATPDELLDKLFFAQNPAYVQLLPHLSTTTFPPICSSRVSFNNRFTNSYNSGSKTIPTRVSFSKSDHALPPVPHDPKDHVLHDAADMRRKKPLVHPDREKIEPGHRQWHYRNCVTDGSRVRMTT